MSAQYRPYRDEEDVPPEERAWVDDGPSGRIQIYEKTTHDIHHVVTQRHLLLGGCTIASVAAIIGLCIGYFAHTEHTVCARGRSVALFSVYDEDPLVKDKILDMVSASQFVRHVKLFGEDSLLDDHIVKITKSEWRKALDEIYTDEFTAPVTTQGSKPNSIEIIYPNGTLKERMDLSLTMKEFVFVGNSINKTINGHLVYASKLYFKDAKYLASKNCTQGAILLVRFGVSPLRQQVMQATSLGAAGILLYQDIFDYPNLDMNAFPRTSVPEGDNWSDNSLDDLDAKASYKNLVVQTVNGPMAKSLLQLLESSDLVAPSRMRGNSSSVYHIGPSSVSLKVTTLQKTAPEKLTNVFGVLRGRVEPDRYIIVGAGRDSWSPSNVGGLASLQELARVFGELKEQKWRPRRSIIFCSFAAEHLGSLGLNHFVKNRLNVLRNRAVAYIDVSNPVFGFKSVLGTGSPILTQRRHTRAREACQRIR
ncbi:transferrin receptor protein 1-like [Galendromus occidentalis]|uniref:Transferrin receptor protein 1-like n=1 Tax=Galendromus occidentalis TaxID=34638 RepID=A0AAJ6QQ89_9ACAR|nr:transferrin receptor protein 1-like [Galendromus occidentalis]